MNTPTRILVALLLFSVLWTPGLHAALPPKPNFIFILSEAQGWSSTSVQMDDRVPASRSDFVRTPALEQLAAEGMRFSDFYASSPRCTPSRASFFTGKSPAALHMTFVGEGKGGREGTYSGTGSKLIPPPMISELPVAEKTIGDLLRQEGYATAHFGKWHVGRVSPSKHGFEENDGANSNDGPDHVENPNPKQVFAITKLGIDFMERKSREGTPFYLQMSHYPGRGGTDARPETYVEIRKRARTERDQRRVASAAGTEDMDAAIGMVLSKVRELGIQDNTYIIFSSDHGSQGRNANEPLTQGKGTVWEGGIRVPFLMAGPGIKPGSVSHVRAIGEDLVPTVAALAGITNLPPGIEGGNLAPVLFGSPDASVNRPREEFVVHFPHYDKDDLGPASALILGNEKLIKVYESGLSKLFDLTKDPGERHDLASERPERVAALEKLLEDYLHAVKALMPSPNPSYDPGKPSPSTADHPGKGGKRRGGGGGRRKGPLDRTFPQEKTEEPAPSPA